MSQELTSKRVKPFEARIVQVELITQSIKNLKINVKPKFGRIEATTIIPDRCETMHDFEVATCGFLNPVRSEGIRAVKTKRDARGYSFG